MSANIGEILQRLGVVDSSRIAAAVELQTVRPSMLFGELLAELGGLSEEQLSHALEIQTGLRSPTASTRLAAAERLLEGTLEDARAAAAAVPA